MTSKNTAENSKAKAEMAPESDDARKPDRPTEIAKPTWTYIVKRTFREFGKDQCPDAAAGLTYYAVLSFFPALLALVSLLGIFGQAGKSTSALLDVLQGIAPGSTIETLRQPIEELTTSTSAGFALVIGILAALWSASGYVGAFSRAMNRVYEVDEGRGFVRLRATMLGVTVFAVVVVALIAGMLVLSGPVADAAGRAANLGGDLLAVWSVAKWPVVIALVILIIAVLYYATPNVKQPRFRWMSIGSFIALLAFVLASLGFGFYVANFSNYNKTYGTIGGVIVMLLWLWILNMSLLFGAEFDAEMERGRELQAGITAEEAIQLPPRGTRRSEKLEKREEEEIVDGARLGGQRKRDADSSGP
ncbi:YihY/virulence factor BrkB family protein [Arthrobacter bambusae]|uniref:YihY/virulence factor BrkB family protein n=1 Tax=Arthrobacter bambusae TaxID=1338426 RepID=UPI002780CA80|nr:YihY/virulence factor BrkB family protein [Arthrobacter bambusae]MDQ0031709.1 membrane protein [Arthrobacter bambusae]MDQ0098750.1 membrane protein [Arthrobacter bambusae]